MSAIILTQNSKNFYSSLVVLAQGQIFLVFFIWKLLMVDKKTWKTLKRGVGGGKRFGTLSFYRKFEWTI